MLSGIFGQSKGVVRADVPLQIARALLYRGEPKNLGEPPFFKDATIRATVVVRNGRQGLLFMFPPCMRWALRSQLVFVLGSIEKSTSPLQNCSTNPRKRAPNGARSSPPKYGGQQPHSAPLYARTAQKRPEMCVHCALALEQWDSSPEATPDKLFYDRAR
jgi:hypothetical protein